MKKALITGITGQDGSYLAEQLMDKGYEVHGLVRRSSSFNTDRLDHLYRDPHERGVHLFMHYGDLTESSRLVKLVYEIQPDEGYHLGAQSPQRGSFRTPEDTPPPRRRDGHGAPAGGDPRDGCRHALLPGFVVRDVRCRGAAAVGDDAVPPAL